MKKLVLQVLKYLPIVTVLFTISIFWVTVNILPQTGGNYFFLYFFAFQIVSNWIAVFITKVRLIIIPERNDDSYIISVEAVNIPNKILSSNGINNNDNSSQAEKLDLLSETKNALPYARTCNNGNSVWYCPRCHVHTSHYCHHCPLCNRCIYQRDHHCVFLGTCIGHYNVKHFIVFCLYASLGSFYTVSNLYVYLYQHFRSAPNYGLMYFLPMTCGKWLIGQEDFYYVYLVLIFDFACSTSICTFFFCMYYIYLVLSGHMRKLYNESANDVYERHNLWSNFMFTFDKWGLMNFLLPCPQALRAVFAFDSKIN